MFEFMLKHPRTMGIAIILLTVLIISKSSWYMIESGTVGVLSSFGKYNEKVQTPGLHFKIPFVEDFIVYDVKMQTANYLGSNNSENQNGIVNRPQISVLDTQSLTINIELSVQYTPVAEQASYVLSIYGENYFEKVINPFVRNVVRDIAGKYNAENIAAKRAEISSEIQVLLTTEFENLKNKPFILNNVSLRNIILPEVIVKKAQEVQLAKQEEQRLRMIEEQTKKNQDIKTIEANTRLIEVTTQAKAEAEQQRIAAEAKAFQITTEAKALAEANKQIAASVTRELIDYRSIEKWNGQYPQMLMMGTEKGNFMLNLPNTSQSSVK